jgi:hypothetical protein
MQRHGRTGMEPLSQGRVFAFVALPLSLRSKQMIEHDKDVPDIREKQVSIIKIIGMIIAFVAILYIASLTR